MRKCYIAGPMRHHPEWNFPAFNAAAKKLRELGFLVINPAETSDYYDGFLHNNPNKESEPSLTRRIALRDVIVLINELQVENRDFICVLPGWEHSKGASAEVAIARWLRLDVIQYSDTEYWTKQ